MKAYLEILRNIYDNGDLKECRTGVDTVSLTGALFKHDMREGFPLLTTKFVSLKTVATELYFFKEGMNDKSWLQANKCRIWDQWANPRKVPYGTDEESLAALREEKDLGEIYGTQWRGFNRDTLEDIEIKKKRFYALEEAIVLCLNSDMGEETLNTLRNLQDELANSYSGIDQLKMVVDRLRTNPFDRRMIVSAWNPAKLDQMALPPCHYTFQVLSDGKHLDLLWNQRSVDTPLGLPYNIASYGLLLEIIAKTVGMIPRHLIGFLADVHYYVNQVDGVQEILNREPTALPRLELAEGTDIFTWTKDDFKLIDYKYQEAVKMPISV